MDLVALLQYGTPIMLGGLFISVVRLLDAVRVLKDALLELKAELGLLRSAFTPIGVCNERHDRINARLSHLEQTRGAQFTDGGN